MRVFKKTMLMTMTSIFLVAVWTVGALADNSQNYRSRYGILGQQAPPLELTNWIDGEGKPVEVSLADYRGKVVYLYFFQHWCPGCHSSGFPALQRLQKAFQGDEQVVLLAVQTTFEGRSTNTQDKVRENQLKYGLTFPMAHDEGSADHGLPPTMLKYRSGGTPWKVLIDPQGRVVFNDFHVDVDKAIEVIRELKPKS